MHVDTCKSNTNESNACKGDTNKSGTNKGHRHRKATPAKVTPAKATPTPTKATTAPSLSADDKIVKEVVTLVNQERSKQGLAPLKENVKLSTVARTKSEDMAKNNYFSHTSPTYGSPFDMMKQFGITYTAAGENIAMGQPTAASVMNGWMNFLDIELIF